MKEFNFIAELEPTPFSRPARATYIRQKDKDFRDSLKFFAQLQMNADKITIFDGAIEVTVKLYRKISPTSRQFGDCDNHLKNILDALNKVVYIDDCQIIRVTCEKHLSKFPHIEFYVREVQL